MKKLFAAIVALVCVFAMFSSVSAAETREIVDCKDRKVSVPEDIKSIACIGVGALRYTCYVGAQDKVIAVEEYEPKRSILRLYNYVNFDKFKDLPIIGGNGDPYVEELISAAPEVIILSAYAKADPDELSEKTGIPVVVVPGSDTTLDDKAYETIRILGELMHKEDRAEQLSAYLKGIQKDLDERTGKIAEDKKPSVYVAGVSYKGNHGFEGTEAYYGPFELIHANNLANTTDQKGAFNVDIEQVLSWDPEYIFIDFNGLGLINEDYAKNSEFYKALSAVKKGNVYSQISFRYCASNLETALADAYYAGKIMFPEQFEDVDVAEIGRAHV